MHIHHSQSVDAAYNMAFEEYLLRKEGEDDYLTFWQSDNTILIGRHQNTPEEINARFVEEAGVHVVRRLSGGGAIYQDLGCLNFSYITTARDASERTMERFTKPVIAALRALGVEAASSGRNDIVVGEQKVCGNAQAIVGKRILHHGSLLFDSDLTVIAGALNVRPEKFRSKSTKSVRSRIANIRNFMTSPLSREEFRDYLLASLTRSRACTPLDLSDRDRQSIEALRAEKYAAWGWNYGKSPACNIHYQRKYPGGFLEVLLDVQAGGIKSCTIFGDFMSLKGVDEITPLLQGIKYTPKDVGAVLSGIDLPDYFGGITRDEIVDCFFGAEG